MSTERPVDRRASYMALAIFVVALALRLVYVSTAEQSAPLRADATKYTTIAYNLVNFGVYSHHLSAHPRADTMITPGYPLFLTLFASDLKGRPDLRAYYYGVVFVQSVLSALTALLITIIGVRRLGRAAGLLAGTLTALSPHLIVGSGYVLTETLFITLMIASLAVWCLGDLRRHAVRTAVIFGALGALAALVRPVYALFPMLIVFLTLYLRADWRLATKGTLAAVLATAVVWTPWMAYKQAHQAPGGQTSLAAAAFALGQYPDLTYKSPQLKGYPYREDPEYPRMIRDLGSAVSVAWSRAEAQPGRYLRWYLIGKPEMFLSWSVLVGQGGPFIYPVIDSIFSPARAAAGLLPLYAGLHPLFVLSGFALALLSLLWLWRGAGAQGTRLVVMVLSGVFVYFVAVHTVLAPLPRYSIPLHPVLYLCFAAVLQLMWARLRQRGGGAVWARGGRSRADRAGVMGSAERP